MGVYSKLNLGCGNLYVEGYKNIDISREVKADEHYDLTLGINEGDSSMEEIQCGCMVEQIELNKDFIFFLNECYRVLKPNGVMKGYVPSIDRRVIFLDPIDRRFFQEGSFDYFNRNKNAWQQFGRVYGLEGWSDTKTRMNEHGILHFELTK